MNYILDIIVVGIILLSVILGMKKGLVKMLLDLAGIVIALAVTYALVNPVSEFVCNKFVITPMAKSVVNTITSGNENADISAVVSSSPDFLDDILKTFNINMDELKTITENNKNAPAADKNLLIGKEIVRPAAKSASYTGTFIVLFVLCLIAVRIVSKLAKFINKIPLIGSFNKGGGALLGLVAGIIAVFVFANIAKAVSYTKAASNEDFIFNEANIQNTVVFKHIYNFKVFDYVMNFTEKEIN